MFKRLDGYIIDEIFPYFGIGVLLYTITLLSSRIFDLMDLLIAKNAGFGVVLRILSLMLPEIISISLPMAFLFGVLFGMSRLSMDSEYLAMRSLGISLRRILKPVLILSVGVFFVNIFLSFYLVPKTNYTLTKEIVNLIIVNSESEIKPRRFIESMPDLTIYIEDKKDNVWQNVFIKDETNKKKDKIVTAKTGRLIINKKEKKSYIRLTDGYLHLFNKKTPEKYTTARFNYLIQPINSDFMFREFKIAKKRRDKTITELYNEIGKLGAKSVNRNYRCEINKRVSLPFASVVFAVLGVGLGLSIKRGGFALSLLIIIIYYTTLSWGENFAIDGYISPFLGLWGPDIMFMIFGVYLIAKGGNCFPNLNFIKKIIKKRKKTITFKQSVGSTLKKPVLKLRVVKLSFRYPKILDRYIIKLYTKIFLFVISTMVFLSLIITFFELVDDILENKKPIILLVRYLWYFTPQIVEYVLPVSALTATLITLGIMVKNNEILAIKALGISVYRISVNLILIGVILSLFAFLVQEKILPFSNKKAETTRNIIQNKHINKISPLKNWLISKNNIIYHYTHFDDKKKLFLTIEMFFLDKDFKIKKRVVGRKGILKDKKIIFKKGWFVDFQNGFFEKFGRYKSYPVNIDEEQQFFTTKKIDPELMNFSQLYKYIKFLKKNNFVSTVYEVDLYYKIAFPIVNVIMIIFSIPFAFKVGKSGTLVGVGIAVAVSFLYWILLGLFRSIGGIGYLPPYLSALGADLIFLLIGAYLMLGIKT